jgi:hypothetical protein
MVQSTSVWKREKSDEKAICGSLVQVMSSFMWETLDTQLDAEPRMIAAPWS